MGAHVIPGDPPVELSLRRSGRARRISLRVSRLDGKVTLTLPTGVREAEALAFAEERSDWIRQHLREMPAVVQVGIGTALPVDGRVRVISSGTGRRIAVSPDRITVPGSSETVPRRLAAFLKTLARDRLADASDSYADVLGRRFERISLRDTRSRWGSCSSRGTLMYSWRLILAPPEVLSYVAAHEVAHLAEMNHSPAYWATLRRIHGPYDAPRRWLRENGGDLHRYRFEA
ncbi:SprT family zinc-dependent metalloprotease [Aestuariivita sp.]|jgi:predicted metal-dependent hydrolase|uniref:M48 family metallopeptidase n=1 Tax=Aestuariivita sp. TaxID=1872407 RepID=UPI00217410B5|nr:SprT family zinc-dependent metalloprotease [Aestuariivita sp.]MCE8006508.1 M48 family metallopeptidase [Aestuariivita sp.]